MTRRIFVDPSMVVSAPKRHRTHDLMGPSRHSAIFASEQIGLKRYKTPEGFLFCEDVPIARIGEMIYGPGEVPIQVSPMDNMIRVSRDAQALFKLETLLSFQGKDITNDHPPDDVVPANWKSHTVGHIMNPRQGEGQDSDVLLADFMIKDPQAIADVLAGKVEVSCGYDAEYHQTEPGVGYQSNIIGNHVALVERGRCGPRCAIGDRQLIEDEDEMKTRDNATATSVANNSPTDNASRIRRHFNDAAEAAIKDFGTANDGVNVHVHLGATKDGKTEDADPVAVLTKTVATVADSVAVLSKQVAKLVKGKAKDADKEDGKTDDESDDEDDEDMKKTDDAEGEEEDDEDMKKKDKKTEDSRALETAFKDTISGVEVLSPGLKTSTFDAKAKRTATIDGLCKMRGRALDRFSMTPAGASVLTKLLDGKTFDSVTLDCRDTAKLFKSAVAVQKASNNSASVGDNAFRVPTNDAGAAGMVPSPGRGNYAPRVLTADEINEKNRKYWEGQGIKS